LAHPPVTSPILTTFKIFGPCFPPPPPPPAYLPACLTLGGCDQRYIPAAVAPLSNKYNADVKNWVELHLCSRICLHDIDRKENFIFAFYPVNKKMGEPQNLSSCIRGKKGPWPCRKSKFGLRNLRIFTIPTHYLKKNMNEIQNCYLCNAIYVMLSASHLPFARLHTSSTERIQRSSELLLPEV
jgi:hypothetical protein